MDKAIIACADGVLVKVKVVPRASKTELCGMYSDTIRIRLSSPPVDGKANKELLGYFAKRLSVSKQQVSLHAGASSRIKRVKITGISKNRLTESLRLPS